MLAQIPGQGEVSELRMQHKPVDSRCWACGVIKDTDSGHIRECKCVLIPVLCKISIHDGCQRMKGTVPFLEVEKLVGKSSKS